MKGPREGPPPGEMGPCFLTGRGAGRLALAWVGPWARVGVAWLRFPTHTRRHARSARSPALCPRTRQLKQMQELEQEKEVLLQGLEMMARGRDWYQQQLQRVQERQRRLSQSRASAVSDAAQGWGVPAPRQRGAPCTCRKHP